MGGAARNMRLLLLPIWLVPLTFGAPITTVSDCKTAVVGGGWAGVYFAWRAADSHTAASVCLFEASARIGGRTYTKKIPETGLTVDVGAYRFSPSMHLPGDLISNQFNLPTECYEPGCPSPQSDFPPPFEFNYSAPLRKVKGGYGVPIHRMLKEMQQLGVRVYTSTVLTDLVPKEAATELSFQSNGTKFSVQADAVLLNLPRPRVLKLSNAMAAAATRVAKILQCNVNDVFVPQAGRTAMTKAYAYYDKAWWLSALNKSQGEYPQHSIMHPIHTSLPGVDFAIHWNDGPTTAGCPLECSGFLEVYYAQGNETLFASMRYDGDQFGLVRHPDERLELLHQ